MDGIDRKGGGEALGERIAAILERDRITQRGLADETGVTISSVHRALSRGRIGDRVLGRMLEGINRINERRGVPHRYSLAELLLGSEPLEPENRPQQREVGEGEAAGREAARLGLEPATFVRLPDYGMIPCGKLLRLEDVSAGEWIELPALLLRRGMSEENTFVLHASGDSMNPTISDGDILLLRRDVAWRSGSIVAAAVNGGTTLKRVVNGPGGTYILQPDNPEQEPITITDADESAVLGVVTDVWKHMAL